MKKIGFVGTGVIGRSMVLNLIKHGYELSVYNRTKSKAEACIAAGAKWCDTVAECAKDKDVVITIVGFPKDVEEVYFGENGILNAAKKGAYVIDMTTTSPMLSEKIYNAAAEKGIYALDAPVSGGEPKAIDGTLSIMCGGKKEVFDKYTDLLKAMGSSVVYVGEIGSGNVAKLANQMVVAANIGICAEAMTFAKKMGTDPELVYQAIRGGLAGSTVMDAKVPMMLAGNYKPGFRIDLHIKDLNNALNASHAINMPVPMTAHMMEVMQELKNHDEGSCDHDDIIRYYERMTGVSIVKEK